MDVIEHTIDEDIDEILDRRLMAHLTTTAEEGPRHSPVWFLWEEECLWIIADTSKRTFTDRIERNPECSVGIVDFDPTTGRLHHVGFRGRATVEPLDPDRAERLLERYFRTDKEQWNPERFGDPQAWGDELVFVRFVPETVVARDQSYDLPAEA